MSKQVLKGGKRNERSNNNSRGPVAGELRKFALVVGGMLVLVFGLAIPWLFGIAFPIWPWLLMLTLVGWSFVHPPSLVYVQSAWMRMALILGRINNAIILSVVFIVLITPIGWIRRTFGHDPISKRFDPNVSSYRKAATQSGVERFRRPY